MKGTTTIARGSYDAMTATSDTVMAYMTAMSGHVDNDNGNGDGNAVTEARMRLSGHDNNEAMGNTMTMNRTTATDVNTVAVTMTTRTAGTTTLHKIGGGNPEFYSGTSLRPYSLSWQAKERVHGGYQLISMLSGMEQVRTPTLLPN